MSDVENCRLFQTREKFFDEKSPAYNPKKLPIQIGTQLHFCVLSEVVIFHVVVMQYMCILVHANVQSVCMAVKVGIT